MFDRFISANRRASRYFRDRMPQSKNDLIVDYDAAISSSLNTGQQLTVLDLGGGAECKFFNLIQSKCDVRVIAVDISADELKKNTQVAEKIQADVTAQIPLPTNYADVAISCYVMEHLDGVKQCIREVSRVLKPGGVFINIFPCTFAPYAIINRALPEALGKSILHRLLPGSDKDNRFPAIYDHCLPDAFDSILLENGFHIEPQSRHCTNGSDYFSFFLPFYLASAFYDYLALKSGRRFLSTRYLSVARKA